MLKFHVSSSYADILRILVEIVTFQGVASALILAHTDSLKWNVVPCHLLWNGKGSQVILHIVHHR